MKNNHYDVIIIGAGPAGASCANELVKNGVKTLIVEKKKLPRNKCCSGLLVKRAYDTIIENFDKIPNAIYCQNKKVKINISNKASSFLTLENYVCDNIYRDKLDFWFLKKAGVEYIDESKFLDYNKSGKYYEVEIKKNNTLIKLRCEFLIGADGVNSLIRRKLDENYNREKFGIAIQKIYKGQINLSEDFFYIAHHKKYSEDNAMASVLLKGNLTYITTGWKTKNNGYFQKWYQRLSDLYDLNLIYYRSEAGFITDYKKTEIFLGKNNVFLCGEATGLISNYYEGISSALITGACLGKIISTDKAKTVFKSYSEFIEEEKKYTEISYG